MQKLSFRLYKLKVQTSLLPPFGMQQLQHCGTPRHRGEWRCTTVCRGTANGFLLLRNSSFHIKLAITLDYIHKLSSRYLLQHSPTCSYCQAEVRYLGFTHLPTDRRNTVNVPMAIVLRPVVPIVKHDNKAIVSLSARENCDCVCLSCSLLSSSPLPLSSPSLRRRSSFVSIIFWLPLVQARTASSSNCTL